MLNENGITFSKIILAVGRSDLRKGIDGLAAVINLKYGLDPLEKDTLPHSSFLHVYPDKTIELNLSKW